MEVKTENEEEEELARPPLRDEWLLWADRPQPRGRIWWPYFTHLSLSPFFLFFTSLSLVSLLTPCYINYKQLSGPASGGGGGGGPTAPRHSNSGTSSYLLSFEVFFSFFVCLTQPAKRASNNPRLTVDRDGQSPRRCLICPSGCSFC
jgi:hypothetical protein